MSMQTWREEFYPVPADQATASDEQALKHSLTKWRGLRPANLERHGVTFSNGYVRGDGGYEQLGVNGSSCALCQLHYRDWEDDPMRRCTDCPLAAVRGGVPCDVASDGTPGQPPIEKVSPYHAAGSDGSVEPMIGWLVLAAGEAP